MVPRLMHGKGTWRCVIGLAAVVATFALASAAWAAPVLGRWEGAVGSSRVVFTVEQTASGRDYVVRPVVFCGPDQTSVFEEGLTDFGPDAWPVTRSGELRDANVDYFPPPFGGRFGTNHGTFAFQQDTCAGHDVRFTASSQPAGFIVPDGTWKVALAPHPTGAVDEVALMWTRGAGNLIESDWGVYDSATSGLNANCLYVHADLQLLVRADGSFSERAPGAELGSQDLTATISGRFVSSHTAVGTYTVTGPGCDEQPVGFTATFSSAYGPPGLATGSGPLRQPAPDEDSSKFCRMRFQVQGGPTGKETPFKQAVYGDGEEVPVTKAEALTGIRVLQMDVMREDKPLYRASKVAFTNLRDEVMKFPSGGVSQGGEVQKLRQKFKFRTAVGRRVVVKEWRLDTQNLRCTNLVR